MYQDVPEFAVVLGNPARVVRYRFDKDIIERINKSAWWENEPSEIKQALSCFTMPLNSDIMEKIETWKGCQNENN